jgi:tripartite-type tricarboxylate transporter receptor subunit TctC
MTFGAVQPTLSYVQAGKLRAIAVTSLKRSPMLPDVPTVAETLPGFEAIGFWGISAPAGTSQDIVRTVNSDIARVLANPVVQQQLNAQGFEAVGGSSEAFSEHLKAELDKWADVIRQAGIKKVD